MDGVDEKRIKEESLGARFLEVAIQNKDKIALCMTDQEMTYEALYKQSCKVAESLIEKGIGQEEIVGIMMGRSIEMIVAILGILMAGGAYMPIEPSYPSKRILYMLENSQTRFVCIPAKAQKQDFNVTYIKVDLEEYEHLEEVMPMAQMALALKERSTAQSLAYVMFTSGSTGEPKGVMVEHQGIIRLVSAPNYITFYDTDKILHAASPVFDAATFEIWGALLNGLTLCIVSQEEVLDTNQLKAFINQYHVTIAWFTVALFNQYVDKDVTLFKEFRVVLTGGDILSVKHINTLKTTYPELTLINGYGPTENTTFSTCFTIDKCYEGSIPIGKCINETTVYILNDKGECVKDGEVGELCFGGKGVARGYLNSPELTKKKFIEDPYVKEERIYRTGDLGYFLSDGNIAFMGRVDSQIKLRGYRIELGEIEQEISKIQGINEVVVKVFVDEMQQKYLCAYYTATCEVDKHALRTTLRGQLPYYMIPAYFVQVEVFPLNTSGKVDKKALKTPGAEDKICATYVSPKNEKEAVMVSIWEKVLKVTPIGIEDSFYELGGDSLKAVQISSLAKESGIKLNIGDLLAKETIVEILKEEDLQNNQFTFVQEQYRMKNLEQLKALRGDDVVSCYEKEEIATSYSLPIAFQTEVTSYLHRSLPLCAILAYDAYKNWYYTNYIQIFAYTDSNKFTEVNYLEPRDSYHDIADVICLGYHLLKNEKSIVAFIKEKITLGYYLIMHLDEYALPCKIDYKKNHFVHPSLIYGYDEKAHRIKAVGFDECRMFCKLDFTEEDVINAYEEGKKYYLEYAPWCAWSAVQLIKPKTPHKPFPFSTSKFMKDLKAYMEGTSDAYRLYDFEYPENQVAYGLEAQKVVASQLKKLLENSFTIDYRGIHLLVEHKKGLYQRLLYIGALKELGEQFKRYCNLYEALVNKWENLRIDYLHESFNAFDLANLTISQKTMIEHTSDEILKLHKEEYDILQAIYKVLETAHMV